MTKSKTILMIKLFLDFYRSFEIIFFSWVMMISDKIKFQLYVLNRDAIISVVLYCTGLFLY